MIVRVTGILVEDDKILLLKQKVHAKRAWSLPGGKVEEGETIENALIRELKEETGLDVKIIKLLYICDRIFEDKYIIHITFLVKKVGGNFYDRVNGIDSVKIECVEMMKIGNLVELGFSNKFINIIRNDFPNSGSYMGNVRNIGL